MRSRSRSRSDDQVRPTKMATYAPAGTDVPAAGCSSTTRPARDAFVVLRKRTTTLKPTWRIVCDADAWSWPMTVGTLVGVPGFGPSATVRRTRVPRFAVPVGDWPRMLPNCVDDET